MAVTTARSRQALAMRGVSRRGTSGQPAGKIKSSVRRLRRSFPGGSFDWHYNFIWPYHVQPAARRDFDGARVGTQLLDFQAQRLVSIAQSVNIRLHANILIGSQRHPGTCPHRDADADGKRSQDNHSKNYPCWYQASATTNFGASANNIQRNLFD